MSKYDNTEEKNVFGHTEPCPFCQNNDVVMFGSIGWRVCCKVCETMGPPAHQERTAILFWNDRSKRTFLNNQQEAEHGN